MICLLTGCSSYNVKEDINYNLLRIRTDSGTIHTSYTDKSTGTINCKDYYWMKAREIHKSEGDYSGKLLDGEYTSHYFEGNLREKGEFEKGLKVGEWKVWYQNGELHKIENFKKGLKNGSTIIYKSDTVISTPFKNGLKHGWSKKYHNDTLIAEIYYSNGIIQPEKERFFKSLFKADPEKTKEREQKRELRKQKRELKKQENDTTFFKRVKLFFKKDEKKEKNDACE
ncbi:toxin-antitoxin system YwqK family antitoxin [Salibacter halophilus]|uniref:Toxin-antitoxin system YwqK family antitoxin n=1 Tax=Salibacter halophilus TaxID=1803916 RepID=A0A6N6M1F9_9FLAO|nr:hypothetical protein [Salibacter halophilus]KAB1061972.1 hypothetical protein F3059_12905 [Salibacter halophilus]